MIFSFKSYIRIFSIFLFFLSISAFQAFAQKQRVAGVVKGENGELLSGVLVTDEGSGDVVGVSNDDGKYSAVVDRNATLTFSSMSYTSKSIKVKGKLEINVVLESSAIKLEEVMVVSQVKNKVMPEPTDIEIKGNYFHLRTRFKVPKELFMSRTRLIVQPDIYNVSLKERYFLRPVVFDGQEYDITQQRMYGFDISQDPLAAYISVKNTGRGKDDIIIYHDSMYVENPRHDYRSDVLMSLETYDAIIYRDSFVIAQGTVNPMRFFDYNFGALDVTDEKHMPKPELQLRNDQGEVKLTFKPGEESIDESDPNNALEIEKLETRLKTIEGNENASLKSFSIYGISSPDGTFSKNEELAKKRMADAMKQILGKLNSATLKYLSVKSDARVENWSVVAALMEKDSLPEAKIVYDIIKQYPNNSDAQGIALKRHDFYRSIIVPDYLSQLRRVEYNFDYSIYRFLNDNEIKTLYKQDYKSLTRHEFYRLFQLVNSDAEKEVLYKQALEVYPKFWLAANYLSALYIRQNRPDSKILEPYVNRFAPVELLSNQAVSLLSEGKFERADSIVSFMPQQENVKLLRAVTSALNGDYEKSFDEISAAGGINEVVLLLAMKRNQQAWEKAKELPDDSAKAEYLKAIAANRLDKVMEAITHIENAMAMDPSLREIAQIDGDVLDLLE